MAKLVAGDQQAETKEQVLGRQRPSARKTKWMQRSVKVHAATRTSLVLSGRTDHTMAANTGMNSIIDHGALTPQGTTTTCSCPDVSLHATAPYNQAQRTVCACSCW